MRQDGRAVFDQRGTNFEAHLTPHCTVIIGDENASYFRPHLAVDRWGGEGRLSFGIQTTERIQPTFDGTTLEWVSGNTKHRYYLVAPDGRDHEFGGIEYEIVVGAHPGVPTMALPFTLAGLTAHHQAPLVPDPALPRMRRPARVDNSYAFYHATQGPMHATAATAAKYQAGKAFHLYRPEAHDALGRRWWVNLTMVAGQMALVIGPEFLLATYPVVIDPTFGFTSVGGTRNADASGVLWYHRAFSTPASSGTLDSLSYHTDDNGDAGDANWLPAIYSDVAGLPSARLASNETGTLVGGTAAWVTDTNLSGTSITSGTQYWLGGKSSSSTTGVVMHFDTVAGNNARYRTDGPLSWPDPAASTTSPGDWKVSIYGTYTESGGAPKRLLTLGFGSVLPLYPAWWRYQRQRRDHADHP